MPPLKPIEPFPDDPIPGTIVRRPSSEGAGLRVSRPYIWVLCPKCGKGRWKIFEAHRRQPDTWCKSCTQRGDRKRFGTGQAVIIEQDDPLWEMSISRRNGYGYVTEHRLVMARSLGRPLKRSEIVHHRNGDRSDNRIENLELWKVKTKDPHGVRQDDYHCPGCRCFD